MTLQEILKAKNLSDDEIQSVIGEMKQNKIFIAGEENLDIRYGKLKTDFDSLTKQHGESSALIEQMKKDNAGNEALQAKITEYESQKAELEKELAQAKLDAELKVALLAEKAVDVDYLTYKVKEKHPDLALGDDGHIKGIDDIKAGLKTQFPNQFEDGTVKKIDEHKLDKGDPDKKNEPQTLAEALEIKYETQNE